MSETIDDLTVEYVEDGIVTLRQLDKVILTKGAWCTILYKIQTWNRSKQAYNPVSYTIRRYQKRAGEFKQRYKFTISSNEQAQKIVDALTKWIEESEYFSY
ncbi:hypothetical protein [Candidatus Coxiella mudrowiae]|uniref:hypothetical protein n=1 Tax=Candidatus Coxiella mudrowiae TaxID=2054173 RepID=UPI000C29112A|nr:hypothetical protein [Candidatus Coxiella mudrowiae]